MDNEASCVRSKCAEELLWLLLLRTVKWCSSFSGAGLPSGKGFLCLLSARAALIWDFTWRRTFLQLTVLMAQAKHLTQHVRYQNSIWRNLDCLSSSSSAGLGTFLALKRLVLFAAAISIAQRMNALHKHGAGA